MNARCDTRGETLTERSRTWLQCGRVSTTHLKGLVALAVVIVTVVSTAHASTVRHSPVTITHVSVRGHVAKVTLRVRGWAAGVRVRIFVDGKYNNFSRIPTLALAVNLRPGKHRISADRVLKGRHSSRSRASKITVPRSTGTLIGAAGDIACDPDSAKFNRGRGTATECHMAATARLITGMRPKLVLPLGDTQYDCGSADAYTRSYGLSWGKFRLLSRPAPGNHEYGPRGRRPPRPAPPPPQAPATTPTSAPLRAARAATTATTSAAGT